MNSWKQPSKGQVSRAAGTVSLLSGLLVGFIIGITSVLVVHVRHFDNCAHHSSPAACVSRADGRCVWSREEFQCGFFSPPPPDCQLQPASLCYEPSWSNSMVGLFASAPVLGGLIGSLATSTLGRWHRCTKVAVSSSTALLCFFPVGWVLTSSFSFLLFTRFVLGVSMGQLCVEGPLLVTEHVNTKYWQDVFGVGFQVSLTFGIFLAAGLGAFMGHSADSPTLLAFIGIVLCASLTISAATSRKHFSASSSHGPSSTSDMAATANIEMGVQHVSSSSVSSSTDSDDDEAKRSSLLALIEAVRDGESTVTHALCVAVLLCSCQQLTGINAVMNYAPQITSASGWGPLTGNAAIMFWNFITTFVSIPLASKYTMKDMYMRGALAASASCFAIGICLFPQGTPVSALLSDGARTTLAAIFIMTFILAFEAAMGPSFFVIATDIFPGTFRGVGCSFVNAFQFVLNLIVNMCFPLFVEYFTPVPTSSSASSVVVVRDGSTSSSPIGVAKVFLLFGTIGLASLCGLRRCTV